MHVARMERSAMRGPIGNVVPGFAIAPSGIRLPAAAPIARCSSPICCGRCSTSATSRRNRSIDSRVVNPKRLGRYIGSKETAMQTTRFERMALPGIFVAGWVAFFSAAVAHAQPLYANPPPPQPPPTFNPSTPYTVPQSPETPVSPGLPSAPPSSSAVVSPLGGSPPGAVARSHRRPVTATETSDVAKTHGGRHSPRRLPRNWSGGSQSAVSEAGWGVCGAFESANRCNAEWSPRSHRCGCIVR
jgi:hypothetical protein